MLDKEHSEQLLNDGIDSFIVSPAPIEDEDDIDLDLLP